MPEVSTKKHYEVNVNMKPLFGAETGLGWEKIASIYAL